MKMGMNRMSGYRELKAQADELMNRVEEARLAELEAVIQEIRTRVAEYGLTAGQIFGRHGGTARTHRRTGIATRKPARRGADVAASRAGSRMGVASGS